MEINILGLTLGCFSTFPHLHRCWRTTHNIFRARTNRASSAHLYSIEMYFYSSRNLSLWLIKAMCLCVSKCELSLLCLIWNFTDIWCVSWNVSVPVWACGYVFGLPSLWEQTTIRAGRPQHREQLWWLSSQLISSLLYVFNWHNKL